MTSYYRNTHRGGADLEVRSVPDLAQFVADLNLLTRVAARIEASHMGKQAEGDRLREPEKEREMNRNTRNRSMAAGAALCGLMMI